MGKYLVMYDVHCIRAFIPTKSIDISITKLKSIIERFFLISWSHGLGRLSSPTTQRDLIIRTFEQSILITVGIDMRARWEGGGFELSGAWRVKLWLAHNRISECEGRIFYKEKFDYFDLEYRVHINPNTIHHITENNYIIVIIIIIIVIIIIIIILIYILEIKLSVINYSFEKMCAFIRFLLKIYLENYKLLKLIKTSLIKYL